MELVSSQNVSNSISFSQSNDLILVESARQQNQVDNAVFSSTLYSSFSAKVWFNILDTSTRRSDFVVAPTVSNLACSVSSKVHTIDW